LHVAEILAAHPRRLPRQRRIAKAWSLPSTKESPPVAIVSQRAAEHLRPCARSSDDSLRAWSEIVADWAPSFPQPRTSVAPRARPLGSLVLRGPALSVAHHLDPGPPASQLVRASTFSTRAVAGNRRPCSRACGRARLALLVGPPGGRRHRRHPPAQDRPGHSPGALSPRSPLAPFHVNLHAGLALSASSLLLPCTGGATPVAALSVRFEEAAPLKKPSPQSRPGSLARI